MPENQGKSFSREHAEHNERLCHHLFEEDDWYDWIVTTAFYAALHFVDDALFPLKIQAATFHTIDEFAESDEAPAYSSKHKLRTQLVDKYLHKAYASFSWLSNKCQTGRYINYQTSKEFAESAKFKLSLIKQECDSKKKKRPVTSKKSKS